MGRGWRMGSMGTTGGVGRTFGLHRHFEKPGLDGKPPKPDRESAKRIAGYFKPYWKKWIVILVCVGASAGLNVLPPFCVGLMIDRAIPGENLLLLGVLAGAMVSIALTSGLVGVLEQTLTATVGQNIMYDLRNQLFRKLQQMSLKFYTTTRSGDIVSRINNDVNAVQGVVTGTIVNIASNFATLLATSIALFSRSWSLALLAIAVVPAFYLPSKLVGRIRRRLSMQTQESQASLLAFMNERLHVGGAILTKIFGQRTPDSEEFNNRSGSVRDLHIKQAIVGRWLRMILTTFSAVGPALIYFFGGWQVMRAELSTGMLVAFAALLGMLYRPLMQLSSVYVDIQGSFAVFDRIFEYLDLKPEVVDKPESIDVKRTDGHIILDNVTFSYPRSLAKVDHETDSVNEEESEEPEKIFALRNLSFEIKPGQRVALVGPSGAGKTTVTYLVPRFYDPDEGRILLDGYDLRNIKQESLRKHMGVVTQETFLFHATIRENLLYARPDASEQEMIDACRAANVHDFIAGLPDRYDTIVGERGFRLSGGEKQRVSISRALLKDPTILILDEATSNLDATSEYLIQTALEKLLEGRTSLIIAHRLSTILSSDRIVVMNEGQVVEQGTHQELLEKRGLYSVLFEQQFGKVLNLNGR